MAAIADLDEDERYLWAFLSDPSGVELAEFMWTDEEQPDGCHRLWPFQWPLYRNEATYQIDWLGRSLGKSVGIRMRAFAFPFNYPGQEMLITAPELNHLRPVTDKIENEILSHRISREMLPSQRGNGINHQPQFQVHFKNNARIVSRLPNRDGRGVKGCIAEGTLVLTERGQVPIEEISPGDRVYTHTGSWKRVLATYRYEDADGIEVAGGGHRGLQMSEGHRMLARRNRSPQRARSLEDPDWMLVAHNQEQTRHYLGSPCEFPSVDVPWPRLDPNLMWVIGRWVADGFLAWQTKASGTKSSARLHVIVDAKHQPEVHQRMFEAYLRPTSRVRENGTYDIEVSDTDLCRFVLANFGQHADAKELPTWLLGAPEDLRRAFLDGYLSGDGHYEPARGRWTAGTASKKLAVGLRLLAQTLGYSCGMSWVDPKVTHVMGTPLKKPALRSWRVTMTEKRGIALVEEGVAWQKIRKVTELRIPVVYDLAVEDDHSYIADGLISHNQHPLVIEMDEGQDFPEQGWIELIETMKSATAGAQWRVHGVSRGVRDRYYRYTMGEDPDIPFYVHRYTAMHRPSWSDGERKAKIAIYGGSSDNIDYRRNIYGDHGDASSTLFVLHRLMACVRINESPWATKYNDDIYAPIKINDELLKSSGLPIESFLQFPGTHLDECYSSFWGGMDVGFTRDPSEILILGELDHPAQKGESLLRLLARIHLMRISAADQAAAVREVFNYYGPRLRRFALDRTGNGLPLWQELDPGAVGTHMDLRRTPEHISQRIKGYNFSSKVAVEFDDRELQGKERPEDAVIEKNVISFAMDELRKVVDTERLELPYDRELLTEWQGQEIQYVRDEGSAAGLKSRVGGSLHTMDAGFMAIAGRNLMNIEEALKLREPTRKPRLTRFM